MNRKFLAIQFKLDLHTVAYQNNEILVQLHFYLYRRSIEIRNPEMLHL